MGNGERPLSYLIHKILSVLQASKGPLSRNEIINLLLKDGVQVSQSNQVWQKIDSHERIRFDINKRKYVYRSPFEDVNSDIALLALIRQYQNGLLIDEDLLKVGLIRARLLLRKRCRGKINWSHISFTACFCFLCRRMQIWTSGSEACYAKGQLDA